MEQAQQNAFDFEDSDSSDPPTQNILRWLARSFESTEEWKSRATDLFYSLNGDSDLARNRLAVLIRTHFLDSPPKPEEVRRWKKGYEEVEAVNFTPPTVTASNSTYIDWAFVADYFLLCCASITERLEAENQRRETESQSLLVSYNIRLVVHHAREEIRNSPGALDSAILKFVRKAHPKASAANVKQARRMEKSNARHGMPKKPICGQPMPRYVALYF